MGEVYIKIEIKRYLIAVKKFNRFSAELSWLNTFWDLPESLFFVNFPVISWSGSVFSVSAASIAFYFWEIMHYQSVIM